MARTRTSKLPKGFFGPEPCVFASGMVLRGNDPLGGKGADAGALVWGYASPGAKVSCAVDAGAPVASTADATTGRWELSLQQKGGPAARTLVFSVPGATSVTLSNVLFGAVFLCSGQSNMDFSVAPWGGGGCLDANETVAEAASGKMDDIRLKKSVGGWFNSSTAGKNKQGAMQKGYAVGQFSAVCYLTALQIKKNIKGFADLPIGLMQSSVGGTVIGASLTWDTCFCVCPLTNVHGCCPGPHRGVDEHLRSRGMPPRQRIRQPRRVFRRVPAEFRALLQDGRPACPNELDGRPLVPGAESVPATKPR
jgi:hypothetical protein